MSERSPEQQIREALLPVRPDDPLTGRYSNAVSALDRLVAEHNEARAKLLLRDDEPPEVVKDALREVHGIPTYAELEQRVTALSEALVEAAVVLEVLAGQIAVKPYAELTEDFQAQIQDATLTVRRAALAVAAGRTPGAPERWDCECSFDGPHDESCTLVEAPADAGAGEAEAGRAE